MIVESLDNNGARSFVSPMSRRSSIRRANLNSVVTAPRSAGPIQDPALFSEILQFSNIPGIFFWVMDQFVSSGIKSRLQAGVDSDLQKNAFQRHSAGL
jgi:hypothetical protein